MKNILKNGHHIKKRKMEAFPKKHYEHEKNRQYYYSTIIIQNLKI